MATSYAHAPVDPRAFLAWENRRKARYELIAGEVRMMSGGSRAHDLIAGTLLSALRVALRGSGCDVHGSNLKVLSPVGMVAYPDLFVRCGSLSDEATECDDPVVVVEVLSPSTRTDDLFRKRWGYQAIPTLQHLVFVDTASMKVELVTRGEDGRWWSEFLTAPEARLRLAALGVEVTLADIYAGTSARPG